MTMCAHSLALGSSQTDALPISSSEALHVRTFPLPTQTAPVSMESDQGCSSKPSASCGNSSNADADPVGSALRTALACEVRALTGFSVGWRMLATPQEETLRFVHEQGARWGVRITWLEFDPTEPFQTAVVGLNSASRNGEPFEAVIRERGMLPNPVASICSQYLKVKRAIAYMRDMLGLENWLNVIGLRHDEPRRVAKTMARNEGSKEAFETVLPLNSARITRRHVSAFWKAQPFDLALPDIDGKTPLGNCDLCFKKRKATIMGIMRLFPNTPHWWIRMEMDAPALGNLRGPELATFRADRPSYRQMLEYVQDQGDIEDDGEESLPCGCHD